MLLFFLVCGCAAMSCGVIKVNVTLLARPSVRPSIRLSYTGS